MGSHVDLPRLGYFQERDAQYVFAKFFRDHPQPSHVFDIDTLEILDVNDAALRLLGFTRDEYVGRSLLETRLPEERELLISAVKNLPWDQEPSEFTRAGTWRYLRHDGTTVLVDCLAFRRLNVSGRRVTITLFGEVGEARTELGAWFEKRMREIAYFDPLTQLPNRASLDLALDRAIAGASGFALVLIDLEHLRSVNSSLGHELGNELLRATAQRVSSVLPAEATLFALGGGTFAAFLPDTTEMRSVRKAARRVIERFSEPFSLGGDDVFAAVKIGIATAPHDGSSSETLLQAADLALQTVGGPEHERFAFFEPQFQHRAQRTLRTETLLRKAIDRRDLKVAYQPIVDAKTGEIVAAEALLRWDADALGSATVTEVIEIAERTGLILPIGEFVLREACAQARRWQLQGLPQIRLCVNVSPRQFAQAGFLKLVTAICRMTAFDPRFLQLELTESTMMSDTGVAKRTLDALRRQNVRLSVDDFGTGYSSLSYLGDFPLDTVKIDRIFVASINEDRFRAAIAQAIITLSHSLGLTVVGEGVERRDQLDTLLEMGCDQIQGFYVSQALDGASFAEMLQAPAPVGV